MEQKNLFPDFGIPESKRLYVIGNGFDIHHKIESGYWDFKKWVQTNRKGSNLVALMDIFFSNDREFWGEIENALGEYDEESITSFCEPDNPEDFKYDHPGQWQDGVEGGVPWIFGKAMDDFRIAFDDWVNSIDISGIDQDLFLPNSAKYLTFNYTETLEAAYGIPAGNVLHIHGSRLIHGDKYEIGHGVGRDGNEPLRNEELLLPYQNAYSEVIRIMNTWKKDPECHIKNNEAFFQSLKTVQAVIIMGLSYNKIDMPYFKKVASSVPAGCKWCLYYFTNKDCDRAIIAASELGIKNFILKSFE